MRLTLLKTTVVFVFLAVAQTFLSPSMADSYEVTFLGGRVDDDGAMRRASVVATLTPQDGKISLFRFGEDSGLYHQWATFLLEIEAQAENGAALEVVYEPHGVWRLPNWRGDEITVRYTMALQHDRFPNAPGDDELAYGRDYGVMWTGRALFISGANSDDVSVSFVTPDGWKVTSPWDNSGDNQLEFRPINTIDLLDSAFFAGTHKETIVNVSGIEARIATAPDMDQAVPIYTDTLNIYLSEYANLFGVGTPHSPVVIASNASFWGGGVMGRSISMLNGGEVVPEMAPMVKYIVAHETFHLWNAQWRYDDDSRPPIEWLAEGVAEYYTKLVGVRSGDLQPDDLLAEIGSRWTTYQNALGEKSISDAGYTKLGDQTSYDLVYSGGMMVSLALDFLIKQETNGAKSLDDVVRLIHDRFARSNGGDLEKDSLIRAINDATGVDVSDFFTRYVERPEVLPVVELLKNAGVCLTSTTADGARAANVTRCSETSPAPDRVWNAWVSR